MVSLKARFDLPNISFQQIIKWLVYSLLLINFAFYFKIDLEVAAHTMRRGGTFLEWTRSFATTIDESAWVLLLVLFELETYVLSDEPLSRPKAFLMHSIRIICYVSLAHTLYAVVVYLYEVNTATVIKDVSNLCQLLGKDISYTANLVYTEINANNCKTLSNATEFVYLDPPNFIIVTDTQAINVINELAWVDLIEAVAWLLILFIIESLVLLQEKGIATGTLFNTLAATKIVLYLLLWSALVYWIYRGHYIFAWDEFMWIAGFFVIGMNMDQWRDEIIAQDQVEDSDLNLEGSSLNVEVSANS